MRYFTLIFVILLVAMCMKAPAVAAMPIGNESYAMFSDDTSGDYICTTAETLREPARCPVFSRGAREARLSYLRARLPDPLPEMPIEKIEAPEGAVTVHTFAYVRHLPAMTYAHPMEAEAGMPPRRAFYAGDNWVSVIGKTEYNGQVWYEINPGEFINADRVVFGSPSRFAGVVLSDQPQYPFAWVNRNTNTAALPGGEQHGAAYKRYQTVTLFAQEQAGGTLWYMVGPEQWLPQAHVARVDVNPRPEGVGPEDKWIEVDTFEQTLAAYEGDRMVFATLVSTGRPSTWTPDGLTRIWGKYSTTPMTNQDVGPENAGWYYLEDVQWTQYFNGAYALHAAYWHDSFGFTRSHGCVNLALLDARWLYNWTTPAALEETRTVWSGAGEGTWVWVHRSEPLASLAAD